MSVPSGPMAGRFNRVRLEHIYRTLRKGPTEAGYAYFRARRRRRNIADDEPLLSESDQLALSGAFDIDEQAVADNARLIQRYLEGGPMEIRTVLWFLPFFHHAYFGGTHTLLRFADYFARVHGVENRFHCYDVASHAIGAMTSKVATAFPALAGSPFTSAADLAPSDMTHVDAAIATLWTSAFPLLHLRRVKAKFYFVQDYEPQFYPAGAASGMVEQTYRFGFPGIVNTPGLADVYRSYGNPAVSFVPAVDLHRYHPAPGPRDPAAPVRVFFYGRPKTPRNCVRPGDRRAGTAQGAVRRPGADHMRGGELEPRPVRADRADREPGGAGLTGRGRGAVSQLRHRTGVHAHQAPQLPAARVHGLRHGHGFQH